MINGALSGQGKEVDKVNFNHEGLALSLEYDNGDVQLLELPREDARSHKAKGNKASVENKSLSLSEDPDLEPGFPVQAYHSAGSYHSGQAIHTLVGNIDNDPELEIIVTALASGPIYVWNYDGTPVNGWGNLASAQGAGYPVLGRLRPLTKLQSNSKKRDILVAYYGADQDLVAYRGNGTLLPGWPISSANYVATPPSLANVDQDFLDEVFTEEEDGELHAYNHDATVLSGWPSNDRVYSQERHTPAIADLDQDGDLEIITVSGATTSGVFLHAYYHDGSSFFSPVDLTEDYGLPDTFPAIGDVDGDGKQDIVVVNSDYPTYKIIIVSPDTGQVKLEIPLVGSVSYGSAPALADLNGDSVPEIIVQTDSTLEIYDGNGNAYPNFPVSFGSSYWIGSSSPVVGDVDGDGLQEIVMTLQVAGSSSKGYVRVYNDDGTLHPNFPKELPIGSGAVPAIADIDLDGRNEIIISGSYWNGTSGYYDKVWVYDLGGENHGSIEWGQFMGNEMHQGVYPASK